MSDKVLCNLVYQDVEYFLSSFLSMFLRLFFLAVVVLLPAQSRAVAMGDVVVRSALGQPLDADIDLSVLSAQEAESLSVRLAPADMFAEAGLDYGAVAR